MVGASPIMRQLACKVRQLAQSRLTVLIHGETGAGKELVARALHALSPRRRGPFRALNCGAIPQNLLEAELFGHERGAFTGAMEARQGLFALAHGGTLLLDEIGELPLAQQPKLLRVLETRRVRQVGGRTHREVDVRVLAATHADLAQRVAAERFRKDLFYRISEADVRVPSLSERLEDIPLLVAHFLSSISMSVPPPSSQVQAHLKRLPWPGNVRELRALVQRAAVLGWDEARRGLPNVVGTGIGPAPGPALSVLSAAAMAAEAPPPYPLPIEQLKDQAILETLQRTGGNKAQAARLLGMPKSTFNDRLRKIRRRTADEKHKQGAA
jgi:DNA-binding NtrC family response regulator